MAVRLQLAVVVASTLSGLGFRSRSRGGNVVHTSTKMIAGVPVLNYNKAHQGKALSLSEAGVAHQYKEDWIVMMDRAATDSDLSTLCAKVGQGCKMTGHPSEGGVAYIEVYGTETDLEGLIAGSSGNVRFVEPNVKVRIFDPIEMETQDVSIAADAPWNAMAVGRDTAATTGDGVHIYIVDSGVRTTHKDFGGRAVPTLDMVDGGKACDGDTSCATDEVGHGTHCAGTAGGGTYGLATDSIIHAVKISFDGDTTWSRVIGAFDWIVANGEQPAVVSGSFGGEGTDVALNEAVDMLVSAGYTFLTSAGNSGLDACGYTPANSPMTSIVVGATDPMWQKSYFSNYGSCIDIWAPGSNIVSLSHSSDSKTAKKQGTSMACPLVAAGVALLLEASPEMSPAQVTQKLFDNAINDQVIFADTLDNPGINRLQWSGTGEPKPPGFYEPCRRRRRLVCYK